MACNSGRPGKSDGFHCWSGRRNDVRRRDHDVRNTSATVLEFTGPDANGEVVYQTSSGLISSEELANYATGSYILYTFN